MAAVDQFNHAGVTAAILAGGEGRRVDGHDKGLLPLAGKPLIAHVAAALHGQVGTIVICTSRHEGDYAVFGQVVPDATTGFRGPLAGIANALAHCATPWLLTVPVDGPNLLAELVRRLHAAALTAKTDAAVAYDGARRQPLFALYRRALAASAAEALAQDLPVWRWHEAIGAAQADFSDVPQAFANLNTLGEFRDWERRHAS
ncbi:MAG TPA: molybdenum cofactor guanylyltransferase MobA [Rudaea sp.]|jgi:molybdopterin-guanine dinucleotide biosynthesis protein A|uniref:molybdenum cofactor guanylyltransferase MobA n=1 Tax=Rudaea sp. TaxID=2136325 RepID=UPI002F92273C